MEAIIERRSVRSYTNRAIPSETVKKLLSAGMSAPSANNDQPWHFIVVTDRIILERITAVQPYAGYLSGAACGIVVCGDIRLKRVPQFKDFWVQDCSAAAENILIAAQAMGLGATWIGVYPVDEWVDGVRTIFMLPDSVIPLCVLSVGYPDRETGAARNRYDPAKVHIDRW